MSPLAQFLLLAAGLMQLSQAVCASGDSSCPQDATSLLQVNNVVKTGSDRSEEEQPDRVLVGEAFENHEEQAANHIAAAGVPGRDFIDGQVTERQEARTGAAENFEEEKEALHESIERDAGFVTDAVKAHHEAVHEAIDTVADAKSNWIESVHDKHMVTDAAVVGRTHGIEEGLEDVHREDVRVWNREAAHRREDLREVMALRRADKIHNAEDRVRGTTQAILDAADDAEDHWSDAREHAEEAGADIVRHVQRHMDIATDIINHKAQDMQANYAEAGDANEAAIATIVGNTPGITEPAADDEEEALEDAEE